MKLSCKILLAAASAIAAVAVRIYYESTNFKKEYYTIKSSKISEAFDGYRFVVISDLHNYDFDNGNKKLLASIRELRPEGVIIAGDIINAQPGKDMDTAIQFMKDICQEYPVYFGNGNHEQRIRLYPDVYGDMQERWQASLGHDNLHMINNDHLSIEKDGERINIYGLEMDRIYYKRFVKTKMSIDYLEHELGICDKNEYNILIAHNPLYFKQYAKWGADLVLSGHVHGGIMILPFLGGVISPQVQLFPEYYAGEYEYAGSRMILSRGLHMHSIPVRLFNMPELSCITLRRL